MTQSSAAPVAVADQAETRAGHSAWLVLAAVQQMSGTIGLALVSLGFFAVAGFRVSCVCDLVLAFGTLTLTRLLAPPSDRSG